MVNLRSYFKKNAKYFSCLAVFLIFSPFGCKKEPLPQYDGKTSFEISYSEEVFSGPITGRVYVMISRDERREPRLQIGRNGTPFFGVDIEKLSPGQTAVIDDTVLGSPVDNLRDIPSGDYYVQ